MAPFLYTLSSVTSKYINHVVPCYWISSIISSPLTRHWQQTHSMVTASEWKLNCHAVSVPRASWLCITIKRMHGIYDHLKERKTNFKKKAQWQINAHSDHRLWLPLADCISLRINGSKNCAVHILRSKFHASKAHGPAWVCAWLGLESHPLDTCMINTSYLVIFQIEMCGNMYLMPFCIMSADVELTSMGAHLTSFLCNWRITCSTYQRLHNGYMAIHCHVLSIVYEQRQHSLEIYH